MRFLKKKLGHAALLLVSSVVVLVLNALKAPVSMPVSMPVQATSPVLSATETGSADLDPVEKVVDGDTIDALVGGKKERIRLIGINTPETVDPRKPVECFGKEASAKTKALLEGKQVRLEADASQDNRDKYGRLLRYVLLEDGTNVNQELVQEGFAHEYTYRVPYKYQAEFKQAEAAARDAKRGLWAPGVCL